MADNVVEKLKDAFEGIVADKKTLVKILSVVLILLLAVVMKLHEAGKADITIESAETESGQELEKETQSEADSDSGENDLQIIYVDIGGAVEEPGVYQVAKDTRLYQVIEMAGGLAENADTDSVNRASFVEDGQKIIIPVKGSGGTGEISSATATPAASDDPGGGLININSASAEELKALNGIGDAMADRIIEYRSSQPFKSKEDIMSVDGIGSKTYDKIKDHITV